MKCVWNDDKCQHGYWIDDKEVRNISLVLVEFACPKGRQALTPNHPVFARRGR